MAEHNGVILHAFNWFYRDIAAAANEIATAGYSAVLVPPPLYSDPLGNEWWQRYQPRSYFLVRNALGGLDDFRAAILALHEAGVAVYCDIVFNHMANEDRADRFDFPGARELAAYAAEPEKYAKDRLYGDIHKPLFTYQDFHHNGNICNWQSLEDSVNESLGGLPDLDLTENVVKHQQACLAALNQLGVDGYRIDAVKHLPLDHIMSVFDTPAMKGKYLFGEALTTNDAEERVFLWPMVEHTHISYYDFALHETLKRAFGPGGTLRELVDPAAFGQALEGSRAVTFTVTHDMPNNDGFRSVMLEKHDEHLAYCYLMARQAGRPLVYSDNNESSRLYPEDRDRWAYSWKRADLAGMLKFRQAVEGYEEKCLYEADGFILLGRGDRGLAAINKTGEWQEVCFDAGHLKPGAWTCQLHGHKMQMPGQGSFRLRLPPRQAQLWLLDNV